MNRTEGRAGLLRKWTLIGTALQLAMVLSGHWVEAIALRFAIIGTLISLLVGLLYAAAARGSRGAGIGGGATVGGTCALTGVLVSLALGDVTAPIVAVATLSGLVAGGLGGLVGHAVAGRRPRAAQSG